jgi:type 2A phosphatase activator TIP41
MLQIPLYQDDLHDQGEIILDAKVRVMPLCWFVLVRMFMRIDHAIVRIRDTRLFHRYVMLLVPRSSFVTSQQP